MKHKPDFPLYYADGKTIDQRATADEAMRRYCVAKNADGTQRTGGEIAEAMKIPRQAFSQLVNWRAIWTEKLAADFLKAINGGRV